MRTRATEAPHGKGTVQGYEGSLDRVRARQLFPICGAIINALSWDECCCYSSLSSCWMIIDGVEKYFAVLEEREM